LLVVQTHSLDNKVFETLKESPSAMR